MDHGRSKRSFLGEGVFLTCKNQRINIMSKVNFSFSGEGGSSVYKGLGINSVFFLGLRTRAGAHAHSNSLKKLNILKTDVWTPGPLVRPSSSLTYWMCVDDFFNWNINDWLADCHHICVFIHIKLFFWFRDITCFFEILPKKGKKNFRVKFVSFIKSWDLQWWGGLCVFLHLLEDLIEHLLGWL